MLALNRQQIFEEGVEDVRRNFSSPLFVDFRFVPVSVEPESAVSQIFRECLPVIAFALQDAADLASSVHLVCAASGIPILICEDEKDFALLAVIGAVEPGLGRV